jgi:hypothetical protein
MTRAIRRIAATISLIIPILHPHPTSLRTRMRRANPSPTYQIRNIPLRPHPLRYPVYAHLRRMWAEVSRYEMRSRVSNAIYYLSQTPVQTAFICERTTCFGGHPRRNTLRSNQIALVTCGLCQWPHQFVDLNGGWNSDASLTWDPLILSPWG